MSKSKKVKSATEHITMSRDALRKIIYDAYYDGHEAGREAARSEAHDINYSYEGAIKITESKEYGIR